MRLWRVGRRPIFWTALIFTLVMANLPSPPPAPAAVNDKWQHGLAFALLCTLAFAAYSRQKWWKVVLGMLAYGVLIELSQWAFGAGRQADFWDVIADSVGICAALLLHAATKWRTADHAIDN